MDSFSAILFDKDGTLFDFHATWGNWAHAFLIDLARSDMGKARKLAASVGFDLDGRRFETDSPIIAATPAEIAACLLPHLPGASPSGVMTKMNRMSARTPQAPATALVPLLEELRGRGLSLGVATNDAEAPARAHLASAGIEAAFDVVLGFDSGVAPKPRPDMPLAFAEAVGADPARVLMVGDSPGDLVAGRAAGMGVIGVLTGVATRRQLAPLADAVLPSIAALPGWLDRLVPSETAA